MTLGPRIFILLIIVGACAPAAGPHESSAPSPTFGALVAKFDYEAAAPLDLVVADPETVATATLRSVSFASPRGGRANALLAVPEGSGPFPAVLMMPGSNQAPATFRPAALELARRGAIVLVADQSQTRPGHTPLFTFTTAEEDEFVHTVVDLRRAVDVLVARADVDSHRLAFWGFSHGAFIGGILAGVERRVTSFLLQSGGGADYLRSNAPRVLHDTATVDAYLATIPSIDPNLYVAHAAPAAIFLQNGSLDRTYTSAGVASWQAAASDPKRVATYQADHSLDDSATADGFAWLASRIGSR